MGQLDLIKWKAKYKMHLSSRKREAPHNDCSMAGECGVKRANPNKIHTKARCSTPTNYVHHHPRNNTKPSLVIWISLEPVKMALSWMYNAAFCGSVPPFPRSSLAHRTGDPSIFARPSTERNHELSYVLTSYGWIQHIVVGDFIFEEGNATCKGCYKSRKLFLSPPRPGRNKRAMTPFSAKTTMLGKPKRRRFNPLRSPPVPLKRIKNKSLPCICWMCGGIGCLTR